MMAQIAAEYVNCYVIAKFNDVNMASTIMNGSMADVFDHVGFGSHKYIPADKLSQDLGEQAGAGVFGYWKMKDGSYVLRTCKGKLAYWSGNPEDKAMW
jgi:hypothetical protein